MGKAIHLNDYGGKLDPPPPPKVYTYEEAISNTESGKFHYFLQLVCGLCLMVVMVETMTASLILPSLKGDLEATTLQQGYLVSANFLGSVLSAHAVGFLADTWGRIKVLRTALTVSLITTVISSVSVNIWMLIILRVLNGMSVNGIQGCVYSLTGEFHGSKTRVRYSTLLLVFIALGCMAVPAIGIVILPIELNFSLFGMKYGSWRLMFLVNSAFSLLTFPTLFLTPESPKYLLIQGQLEKSLNVLRKVFSVNTGRPKSEYPVQDIHVEIAGGSLSNVSGFKEGVKLMWSQTVPLFHKERVLYTLNIGLMLYGIYGVGHGIYMWYPTILSEMISKSGNTSSICEVMASARTDSATSAEPTEAVTDVRTYIIMIITTGIYALKGVLYTFLIHFFSKKTVLFFWIVFSAMSALVIHWISSFVLTVILITFVTDVAVGGNGVTSIAMEYFPANVNSMGMCLLMTVYRLGSFTGSNFVGFLLHSHCNMLFYVLCGVLVLLAVLSTLLPTVGLDKTKEENKSEK